MGRELENIDLTAEQRNKVIALLKRYLPDTEVWAYGSRVKFTSKPSSDLDMVAFASKEQGMAVADLKEAFEESDLPFRVDLFVWDEVPKQFHKNIEAERVVLQGVKNEQVMASDWTTIGEISDVFDGPHATPKKIEEGPYFLSISSLENGKLDLSKSAHLSEEQFIKWTRRVTPQEDDLLFSYETRLGEAALMPPNIKSCLGRRMGLLRPDLDKVIPEYLLYAYLSPDFQSTIEQRKIQGCTVDRIALKELPCFPIRIPPLPEQKAIAHILGSLDDKIELNRRMNESLEGMAQALFKSWFTDFDPVIDNILVKNMIEYLEQNQPSSPLLPWGEEPFDAEKSLALWERLGEGSISFPTGRGQGEGFIYDGIPEEFAARAETRRKAMISDSGFKSQVSSFHSLFPSAFQQTEEMGWIPAGWEVSTFGDVASAIRDSVNPSSLDADVPYVGLEHIGRRQMYLSDWGYAGDVDSNKSAFHSGDVLFGKLRPYFHKVCIMSFAGICSTDILVFRAKEECWKGFVQYQLFDEEFVEYANARSTGTRMPRASWKDMVAYPIAKPSSEVATRFAELVEGFNAKAMLNVESSSKLANLRDTLLPKLISGELRIEEAEKVVKAAAG